jgi:hypothetical protein
MTNQQEQEIRSIIGVVTKEYGINLCSPVKAIKEAVDVTAFLISKNVGVKQMAIASILGRSTASEFTSVAIKNVKTRIRDDDGFKKKLINLEIKILSGKL